MKKNQGFTIIELLIAVAISSLLLLLTFQILTSFEKINIKESMIYKEESKINHIFNLIIDSVKESQGSEKFKQNKVIEISDDKKQIITCIRISDTELEYKRFTLKNNSLMFKISNDYLKVKLPADEKILITNINGTFKLNQKILNINLKFNINKYLLDLIRQVIPGSNT